VHRHIGGTVAAFKDTFLAEELQSGPKPRAANRWDVRERIAIFSGSDASVA
jgi:hypothetical protein